MCKCVCLSAVHMWVCVSLQDEHLDTHTGDSCSPPQSEYTIRHVNCVFKVCCWNTVCMWGLTTRPGGHHTHSLLLTLPIPLLPFGAFWVDSYHGTLLSVWWTVSECSREQNYCMKGVNHKRIQNKLKKTKDMLKLLPVICCGCKSFTCPLLHRQSQKPNSATLRPHTTPLL